MLKGKDLVPNKNVIDTVDITAALEFLKRYYPTFWDRIDERDLMRLMVVSHLLFKTNPELLSNTNTPTQ